MGEETFAADPYPRQRLVAVGEVREVDWYYTVRLEVFRGVPFTPAVAMIPERAFDFGLGRFADPCYGTNIQYLYGAGKSQRRVRGAVGSGSGVRVHTPAHSLGYHPS